MKTRKLPIWYPHIIIARGGLVPFALLSIMEVEPAQPKPEEAVTADAAPAATAAVAAPAAMELEDNSNTASASSGAPNKKRKSEGASKRLEVDPLGLPATSKRERKTVAVFEAEDFQAAAAAKAEARTHLDGRGTKLEDIPSTCESIKAAKMKGQELKMAHQLVFGGASKEKLRKQQLLEFSGYLPTKSTGASSEEQEAIDNKLEVCCMCCYYYVLNKWCRSSRLQVVRFFHYLFYCTGSSFALYFLTYSLRLVCKS